MGKQARLYMVRSTQGALYDVFFERGVAALAWPMLAEAAAKGFGDEKMSLVRPVEWLGEVCRDDLSVAAQRALGSVATLFAVSEACAAEIFERVGFQTA